MVRKNYDWENGAELKDHSRRKHKILRQYVYEYLMVRCTSPLRSKFRIAIVDGFSGAGRYKCGTAGSPVIFIEELSKATNAINLKRKEQNFGPVDVDCLLILNDENQHAVKILKENLAPLDLEISESCPHLNLKTEYLNQPFEEAYPAIKASLVAWSAKSVIFNLDPCGYSHITEEIIRDIMASFDKPEILLTFLIKPLLAFLQNNNPGLLRDKLAFLGVSAYDLDALSPLMSKPQWLGVAEKLVHDRFTPLANFVTPFSIHNPGAWRYWYIHFAKFYRAREVFNSILHDNATMQAHFGRAGLHMLSYNPEHEGQLFLFGAKDREVSKEQLADDIPRLIDHVGKPMQVDEFFKSIYNLTPAHKDDICATLIEHPDIKVSTSSGHGERQKAHTIEIKDILSMRKQISFSYMRPSRPIPGGK